VVQCVCGCLIRCVYVAFCRCLHAPPLQDLVIESIVSDGRFLCRLAAATAPATEAADAVGTSTSPGCGAHGSAGGLESLATRQRCLTGLAGSCGGWAAQLVRWTLHGRLHLTADAVQALGQVCRAQMLRARPSSDHPAAAWLANIYLLSSVSSK
jgi:hypothetical protein